MTYMYKYDHKSLKGRKYAQTDFHKLYGYIADKRKLNTDEYKGLSKKELLQQYNAYVIKVIKGNDNYLFKARELSYYLIHYRDINPDTLMYYDMISLNRKLICDDKGNIYLRYNLSAVFGYIDPVFSCDIPIGYNVNSKAIKKLNSKLTSKYNPDLF